MKYKTTYTGFDGATYDAYMIIENRVVTEYRYYDGNNWIDTEEKSFVSDAEISEILEVTK